jgi:hypothetical protein
MPPANPDLLIQQVSDLYVRQNFEKLRDYFSTENQLLGFKFYERSFLAAVSGMRLAHGLPNIPLDIIVTHLSGTGDVTFNYGEFDDTYLSLDVSGPCRIRFFVGTYSKLTTNVQTADNDAQKFTSGV